MSSAVREALEGYAAGRVRAEGVVAAVAAAYYGPGGRERSGLRPVVDVMERASPGFVELTGKPDSPGFDVRLAERPFPRQYEADLRRAVAAALATDWERTTSQAGREGAGEGERPAGLLAWIVGAVRRLFG